VCVCGVCVVRDCSVGCNGNGTISSLSRTPVESDMNSLPNPRLICDINKSRILSRSLSRFPSLALVTGRRRRAYGGGESDDVALVVHDGQVSRSRVREARQRHQVLVVLWRERRVLTRMSRFEIASIGVSISSRYEAEEEKEE
jgi:hypothetical protein